MVPVVVDDRAYHRGGAWAVDLAPDRGKIGRPGGPPAGFFCHDGNRRLNRGTWTTTAQPSAPRRRHASGPVGTADPGPPAGVVPGGRGPDVESNRCRRNEANRPDLHPNEQPASHGRRVPR